MFPNYRNQRSDNMLEIEKVLYLFNVATEGCYQDSGKFDIEVDESDGSVKVQNEKGICCEMNIEEILTNSLYKLFQERGL